MNSMIYAYCTSQKVGSHRPGERKTRRSISWFQALTVDLTLGRTTSTYTRRGHISLPGIISQTLLDKFIQVHIRASRRQVLGCVSS
jgi:hypothetical protein